MGRGKRNSKSMCNLCSLFILLSLTAILFTSFAAGQQSDSDSDGVIDSSDLCPETNPEEGLPIITQNKEYVGCSCSQIYAKIGDEYCFDVFCSTNRPFSLKARAYSSRQTDCGADYCIDNTLYDFPSNKSILCFEGKEESFSCSATIIEDSNLCINGSVAQFMPEQDADSDEEIVLLDDYEKLQNRAYALSQDMIIRSTLGISGENIFLNQAEKTSDFIVIEKNLKTETKTIGNTEKVISIETITITPKKHRTFKEVYVFEELPRGSKTTSSEVIPETEGVVMQEDGPPVIIVWEIKKISEPVEISYQVNKQLQGESNTMVIAKEVRNDSWKLIVLSLVAIAVLVLVFVKASEKSIPKRKKIFKD